MIANHPSEQRKSIDHWICVASGWVKPVHICGIYGICIPRVIHGTSYWHSFVYLTKRIFFVWNVMTHVINPNNWNGKNQRFFSVEILVNFDRWLMTLPKIRRNLLMILQQNLRCHEFEKKLEPNRTRRKPKVNQYTQSDFLSLNILCKFMEFQKVKISFVN